MILLGATALFSKLLPLSAIDITFGRAAIACIMLFGIVKIFRKSILLDRKKDSFVALFLGLLMSICWHDSLIYIPRNDSTFRTFF
jgi:hypothetical protein